MKKTRTKKCSPKRHSIIENNEYTQRENLVTIDNTALYTIEYTNIKEHLCEGTVYKVISTLLEPFGLEPYFTFYLKWDGCYEINTEGNLHFCNEQDVNEFNIAVLFARRAAADKITRWNNDV